MYESMRPIGSEHEPAVTQWLDLVRYDAENDRIESVVRVVCERGVVRLEPSGENEEARRRAEAVRAELQEGILTFPPDTKQGRVVRPQDGESFLRAVEGHYRDPHLQATAIQEGAAAKPFETPGWENAPEST